MRLKMPLLRRFILLALGELTNRAHSAMVNAGPVVVSICASFALAGRIFCRQATKPLNHPEPFQNHFCFRKGRFIKEPDLHQEEVIMRARFLVLTLAFFVGGAWAGEWMLIKDNAKSGEKTYL